MALLAVVVTAVSVQRLTASTLESAIEVDLDAQIEIRDSLAFYGLINGDWTGVELEVTALAQAFDQRLALADFDGTVLADSARLLDDEEVPLPRQSTIVDPSNAFFSVDLDDGAVEQLDEVNDVTEFCLDEVGVGVAFNEVGLAIPVEDLDPDLNDGLVECVGNEFGEEFGVAIEGDADAIDLDDWLLEASRTAETAPPLQLFIGYGDERDGSLTQGLGRSFWIAVALVMAVAVATTLVLANRILRPVASLTAAAQAMTDGDLTTRVEVSGADELGALGTAFNEMATNIEAEDRARRTLTIDVAHELRSPLANLRGYLEAVQDGVLQADEGVIASLHEETLALQGLVNDLQELSLAETGRLGLKRSATDMGDLVERAVAAHHGAATAADVELTADTAPGLVSDVDGDRIRQILANLIGNAIRHTPPDGTVSVTLIDGDPLLVTVTDTGEGIGAEHLPQLFDRFYRADQSRTRATGGTGLGLAIARELARAHDGDLTVSSSPGHGSTFTLSIPRR